MCNAACIAFGKALLLPTDMAGKDVLEIGSRNINGSLRPHILEHGPKSYIGIDILKDANVDMVVDAADALAVFGEKSFDLIVSTEAFEHIERWKQAISNVKRMLRDTGAFVMTVRRLHYRYHECPADYWRWAGSDVCDIFSDCSVEVVCDDYLCAGVYARVRKRPDFVEKNLDTYSLTRAR